VKNITFLKKKRVYFGEMFNPDWGGDMTKSSTEKFLIVPESEVTLSSDQTTALEEFLENTALENLTSIMASLGEKKPNHTVLDTLVSIALASTFIKQNGQITIGTMILPNQQTPEQELFVDVIAGFIGNQLTDKLQEQKEGKDPEDATAMFEARQAFVQDDEVIGLVGLLKNLKDYVSSAGISALDTVLEDFTRIQQVVTRQIKDSQKPQNG
jgi:hypothetical protein